jgi:UDP-N-acetyl-D-galactosamine dehydrogenase
VAHKQFTDMGGHGIRALGNPECVVFDVKNVLPKEMTDDRL